MLWWLLSAASAETLVCGSVIDRDTVLETDISCPLAYEGPALVIRADGVKLDGAGHKVRAGRGPSLLVEAGRAEIRDLDLSASPDVFGQGVGLMAHEVGSLEVSRVDVSGQKVGISVRGAEVVRLSQIEARRASSTALQVDTRALYLDEIDTEGSDVGLALSGIEEFESSPLSFRNNRLGATIEGGSSVEIRGWSFDGLDGRALSLSRCDGCSVSDSSFAGAREGIAISGEHDTVEISGNDLSFVYGGPALSIEGSRGDIVRDNLFEGSTLGIRLQKSAAISITPDNTFASAGVAISVEDSRDMDLVGLMLDGFSGRALSLEGCDGCSVSDSSLVGTGVAISVNASRGAVLSGNDLRESGVGVAIWGGSSVEIDGSNDLFGISGALVAAEDSEISLEGLTASSGLVMAQDSAIDARDHRSCGAGFSLLRSTASLSGFPGHVSAEESDVTRGEGAVPDADLDGLPDACDPCDDPDGDNRCGSEDPCLGLVDSEDKDGDGWCVDRDCDDKNAQIHPGADDLSCNGIDDDCDPGTIDRPDRDNDSFVACEDCDDSDPETHPGAAERCDGRDQDCDSLPDDDLPFDAWFADADHDGYGDSIPAFTCGGPPAGYVANHADCDDKAPEVHPGAPELLHNGQDDDCNDLTADTEAGTIDLD